MDLFKKMRRGFIVLVMSPFCWLETKERERRLEEKLKRAEQKRKYKSA